MEWDGVIWSEMEWNGVKWSEMEWDGVRWSEMEWNGVKWSEMEWNGVKWSDMELNGVKWWNKMTKRISLLTISTSEIGPILLTCMLISTTKGGPEKKWKSKVFWLRFFNQES